MTPLYIRTEPIPLWSRSLWEAFPDKMRGRLRTAKGVYVTTDCSV